MSSNFYSNLDQFKNYLGLGVRNRKSKEIDLPFYYRFTL